MKGALDCHCKHFGPPVLSRVGLRDRAAATQRFGRSYAVLATNDAQHEALVQCRKCGKLYQQGEHQEGMGVHTYMFEVPEIEPAVWRENPFPDLFLLVVDRDFYQALGPEDASTACRRADCTRPKVALSICCRRHHFEQVKGYDFEALAQLYGAPLCSTDGDE